MRYAGKFGFATKSEVRPGVWEDVITEREYLGDVIQRTERQEDESSVLPTAHVTTSFSVLSDGVLKERYSDLRYVTHRGVRWSVNSVIHKWPRLEIYIGEEYNGPTPGSP
jgi:hypothetical protein